MDSIFLVILDYKNSKIKFLVDAATAEFTYNIKDAKRYPNIYSAEEASLHINGASILEKGVLRF